MQLPVHQRVLNSSGATKESRKSPMSRRRQRGSNTVHRPPVVTRSAAIVPGGTETELMILLQGRIAGTETAIGTTTTASVPRKTVVAASATETGPAAATRSERAAGPGLDRPSAKPGARDEAATTGTTTGGRETGTVPGANPTATENTRGAPTATRITPLTAAPGTTAPIHTTRFRCGAGPSLGAIPADSVGRHEATWMPTVPVVVLPAAVRTFTVPTVAALPGDSPVEGLPRWTTILRTAANPLSTVAATTGVHGEIETETDVKLHRDISDHKHKIKK